MGRFATTVREETSQSGPAARFWGCREHQHACPGTERGNQKVSGGFYPISLRLYSDIPSHLRRGPLRAFEYVGFGYMPLAVSPIWKRHLLSESFAAVAGHGLVLCPDIKHPETCWDKDNGFEGYYYTVDYTNSRLFAFLLRMNWKGPYTGRDLPEYSLELGSDFQHKNPDEDHY